MQGKIGDSIMVAGKATKDAELKLVGDKQTPLCEFSIATGKRPDTTTIFANCKVWSSLARYAQPIRKGDTVVAVGKIESREYNGKTYSDLVVEWLDYIPRERDEHTAPSGKTYHPAVKFEESSEADSENDLPF